MFNQAKDDGAAETEMFDFALRRCAGRRPEFSTGVGNGLHCGRRVCTRPQAACVCVTEGENILFFNNLVTLQKLPDEACWNRMIIQAKIMRLKLLFTQKYKDCMPKCSQ